MPIEPAAPAVGADDDVEAPGLHHDPRAERVDVLLAHVDPGVVIPSPGMTAMSWVGIPLHCPIAMAKVCHSCGKGPSFGNSRSHSMVATKRRFDPNLQKVRALVDGAPRRVYVCTRCLKAGKVTKAV